MFIKASVSIDLLRSELSLSFHNVLFFVLFFLFIFFFIPSFIYYYYYFFFWVLNLKLLLLASSCQLQISGFNMKRKKLRAVPVLDPSESTDWRGMYEMNLMASSRAAINGRLPEGILADPSIVGRDIISGWIDWWFGFFQINSFCLQLVFCWQQEIIRRRMRKWILLPFLPPHPPHSLPPTSLYLCPPPKKNILPESARGEIPAFVFSSFFLPWMIRTNNDAPPLLPPSPPPHPTPFLFHPSGCDSATQSSRRLEYSDRGNCSYATGRRH